MEKIRGYIIRNIALTALFLIILTHSSFHFVVYGLGSNAFDGKISGFSIGKFPDEFKIQYPGFSPVSLLILILEWLIFASAFIFIFIKNRREIKVEIAALNDRKILNHLSNKTDIDVLHDLLKEKGHIRLSTISKIFNVDKNVASEWAQILEEGGYATINYPQFSDAVLSLNK